METYSPKQTGKTRAREEAAEDFNKKNTERNSRGIGSKIPRIIQDRGGKGNQEVLQKGDYRK